MGILHNADLPVKTAALAVIAFGVQLRVHDIVINMLKERHDCRDIALHIRNFHIADGPSRGQSLELGLDGQLVKSVDLLHHMDMVAVGNVILVRHALDDAKPLLEALGKLIGGGLQRGPIQGEVNVLLLLPPLTGVVESLHHFQGKWHGLRIRVRLACHVVHALVQARVAQGDGGVSAVEKLVNGLPLLQSGQGPVLPQDRGHVRQSPLKTPVPAHQGLITKLQPFI